MKDDRQYRNLYLTDAIGCRDHLVEFTSFPEYSVDNTVDEPSLDISVPLTNLYFNCILPPFLCWDTFYWTEYFKNNFLRRFPIFYKMIRNKDYYSADFKNLPQASIFDMEIQNEDLYFLAGVSYIDPIHKGCLSEAPFYIVDCSYENYVLCICMSQLDKDTPAQIRLSVFLNKNLPFWRRIKNSFRYLFGGHPDTIEFSLEKDVLNKFKNFVQYAIEQWESLKIIGA
jgi:hypothetical protein